MSDLVERLREQANRAADWWRGDDAATCTEAAARIQALETSLAEAEGRVKALMIALHDAVRRPMGVVPESAEPFYLPSVADQVRPCSSRC